MVLDLRQSSKMFAALPGVTTIFQPLFALFVIFGTSSTATFDEKPSTYQSKIV